MGTIACGSASATTPASARSDTSKSATAACPADGLTIGTNRHGDRTFFADNWPNRAHHWLPVVDHPSDKALVSFAVTAPAHYQVVATGAFVEAVDLDGGRRRTEWRSRAPVATKVMAIGVARFARRREATVDGVPVETWVYPQDREAGLRAFAPAARVVGTFERRLGEYPYAKLANVQTTTRWAAWRTRATCSTTRTRSSARTASRP